MNNINIRKELKIDLLPLARVIAEQSLTHEYLAHRLSLSRPAFTQKLNGKRKFTAPEMIKLAFLLDMTIDELNAYIYEV